MTGLSTFHETVRPSQEGLLQTLIQTNYSDLYRTKMLLCSAQNFLHVV